MSSKVYSCLIENTFTGVLIISDKFFPSIQHASRWAYEYVKQVETSKDVDTRFKVEVYDFSAKELHKRLNDYTLNSYTAVEYKILKKKNVLWVTYANGRGEKVSTTSISSRNDLLDPSLITNSMFEGIKAGGHIIIQAGTVIVQEY